MKYRSVIFIILLVAILMAPASASLSKIDAESPVFIGETGIDISSALNGCRQIAWWPAGNTTDTPPGKIVDITGDMFNYTLSPAVFSEYEGWWYSYDKKPIFKVFEVLKPKFDLKVWDLDHDADITGLSVPVSTRITYRIDTNLYVVFNKYQRPDLNNLDSFIEVSLTGPTGKAITTIYTGSGGNPSTLILAMDTKPQVTSSPYYWKNGGEWNHSSKKADGTILYPLGTYTFTASQNLNNMRSMYNATDPEITTGPKTVTFIADIPTTSAPSPTQTEPSSTAIPQQTAVKTITTTPARPTGTTATVKPTWTSTPLPAEITAIALCGAGLLVLLSRRRSG